MNELDHQLALLWQRDMPRAQDAIFMLSTVRRIERRRLVAGLLRLVLLISAASLMLVLYAPLMQKLLDISVSALIMMDSLNAILLSLSLVLVVVIETGLLRSRV